MHPASKALSRLALSPLTHVTLRRSVTSESVPTLPQALLCDVVCRLHALKDVLVRLRSPSEAADFPCAEIGLIK